MRAARLLLLLLLGGLLLSSNALPASSPFDDAMQPILSYTLQIGTSLGSDSTYGVQNHAVRIVQAASALDVKSAPAEHAGAYAPIPAALVQHAAKLGKASDLAAMRDAYKGLSAAVILWVTRSQAENVLVLRCDRLNVEWVQAAGPYINPYEGKSVTPVCGQVIYEGKGCEPNPGTTKKCRWD